MKADEILDKAADYIAEHGFWQNDMAPSNVEYKFGVDAPCCGYGAVNKIALGHFWATNPKVIAEKRNGEWLRASLAMKDYAKYTKDNLSWSEYNDTPGRRAEEVIAALHEIATTVREKDNNA